jgi:hypothetical protein
MCLAGFVAEVVHAVRRVHPCGSGNLASLVGGLQVVTGVVRMRSGFDAPIYSILDVRFATRGRSALSLVGRCADESKVLETQFPSFPPPFPAPDENDKSNEDNPSEMHCDER